MAATPHSWLATTAKPDERVMIGPDIVIHVFRGRRGRIDLRISAPQSLLIRRELDDETISCGVDCNSR